MHDRCLFDLPIVSLPRHDCRVSINEWLLLVYATKVGCVVLLAHLFFANQSSNKNRPDDGNTFLDVASKNNQPPPLNNWRSFLQILLLRPIPVWSFLPSIHRVQSPLLVKKGAIWRLDQNHLLVFIRNHDIGTESWNIVSPRLFLPKHFLLVPHVSLHHLFLSILP